VKRYPADPGNSSFGYFADFKRLLSMANRRQFEMACSETSADSQIRWRRARLRPLLILRKMLQRLPFTPLDINELYLMEYIGIPPEEANFHRARATVRSATVQDLDELAKCQNTPDAFLSRFRSNHYCVVAVLDGQVVGYEWFCDNPSCVEARYSLEIAIPSDAIYAYDGFILPEHRLGGIWVKFQSAYLRELMLKRHRQRIVTIIDYGNSLSMNTHLRFGFKPVRKVFVIKVFGKSFFFRRTLRPSKSGHLWPFHGTASEATGALLHSDE
jgi:hypothetical protein